MSELRTAIEDAQASFRAAFRIVLENTRNALRATADDYALSTPHSPAEPVSPVPAATEVTGGVNEPEETRDGA